MGVRGEGRRRTPCSRPESRTTWLVTGSGRSDKRTTALSLVVGRGFFVVLRPSRLTPTPGLRRLRMTGDAAESLRRRARSRSGEVFRPNAKLSTEGAVLKRSEERVSL
jgi:hypothetical protein